MTKIKNLKIVLKKVVKTKEEKKEICSSLTRYGPCRTTEAGVLVRVQPEPCLILSRAQIRALLCSSKSKFIPA
jgi:hypothetical protein